MVDDLRNGGLLSAAAAQHPEVFPNYYIGILQAAELTGRLDESLESLAGYLEREIETRSKVVSALSYPVVVMVLALFTVLILAGYVLPQFKPLFEELDADLPLPTRMMLFFARFFTDLWYITARSSLLFIAIDGVPVHAPDGQGARSSAWCSRSRSSRASSSTRSSSASAASCTRCAGRRAAARRR